MTDRPYLICEACQTPVPTEDAYRGPDGEPYHPNHYRPPEQVGGDGE